MIVSASGLMSAAAHSLAFRACIVFVFLCSVARAELQSSTSAIKLTDPDAARQMVIIETIEGVQSDITRSVEWKTEPAGVVHIDETGLVRPAADGNATITAKSPSGQQIKIAATVSSFETRRAISFPNDVIPAITRAGCNSGACHGTPKGRNGFRLSLLGFEPKSDFEVLTRESRGRRFFPAAPERSLLLQKASGDVPHGGGVRITHDEATYEILKRWMLEGMSYGPENDPTVERIEVFPTDRVIRRETQQQLAVTAFMSDGTTRDVTRAAEFKANQPDMCGVDEHGLVSIKDQTGTTSVMVRFQEHVASFMATIPLGAPVLHLPEPNNFVDRHVFDKWKVLGLPPSPTCDDSTFVRRAAIDIAGRLPTLEKTTQFLESTDAKKREQVIDHFLASDGYATLFANKWSGILRNKAGGNLEQVARETYGFHAWIRESLRTNQPFDQFATQLLTARGKPGTNPAVSWYRAVSDTNERMADIAQVFLGVRIQCAQCHHHPYEKWSQDDYHGFKAFFTTLARKEVRKLPEDDILYHKRILAVAKNPNNDRELKPTPLDAEPLAIPASRDPRVELAKWVTAPANPYFAKVTANRYWKHFFGRGLVEPEDDIRVTNPATHPELLNELAQSFIDSGYDLKQLCRTICNTEAYQRSSIPNQYNGDDEQNFARCYPRRLPAEIMLDSMNAVAGSKNSFNRAPVGALALSMPDDNVNRESFFVRVFGRPQMDTACECERSENADLAQSLTLLNSDTMQKILTASGGTAYRYSRDKETDDNAKVRDVYLHALSRPPTDDELSTAIAHLKKKADQSAADPSKLTPENAAREGWEDILWVVMNTKEFLFNH